MTDEDTGTGNPLGHKPHPCLVPILWGLLGLRGVNVELKRKEVQPA